MGSKLFKNFIKKAILERQPGGPPRPGLQWKPSTHRWIRPASQSGDVDQEGPERDDYDLGSGKLQGRDAEFKSVKNDVDEVRVLISNGERFGWSGKDNLIPKRLAETLASIEETIGYNSQEAHESGEGGQTPLQIMVDQVYGAIESQRAFGGLQVSSWAELQTEVGDYLAQNTSEDYWVDFDINEHKDGIKNYLDEVWTDYNHLSPDKIQDKILMPLVEDLDIVLPNDDEGMDQARESLEGYLGEAIQRKWLSSMGKTGRELGRMGESKRKRR